MVNLHFPVVFPRLDQAGSPFIAHVDAASRRVHEAVGAYLPATDQGHDEPVCQCAQLFGKVKGQRRPARPRAVKEPHLVVQADALCRADELSDQDA